MTDCQVPVLVKAGSELDKYLPLGRLYFVFVPSPAEECAFDRDTENSQGSYGMAEEIRCTRPEGRGASP